ncbi:Protein SOSEKI 1 [Microbotryomycetes sp. JL221]|nr:Protein SOSEKI 1 [Microbotryomycetes sp. JL221]
METSHSVAHHDAAAAGALGSTSTQRRAAEQQQADDNAHEFEYSVAVTSRYSSQQTESTSGSDCLAGDSHSNDDDVGPTSLTREWTTQQDACMHDMSQASPSTSSSTIDDRPALESTYLARSGPVATPTHEPTTTHDVKDMDEARDTTVQHRRRSVHQLLSERMQVGTSASQEATSVSFEERLTSTKRHARRWSALFDSFKPTPQAAESSTITEARSLPPSPKPGNHQFMPHRSSLLTREQALRRRATSLPPLRRQAFDRVSAPLQQTRTTMQQQPESHSHKAREHSPAAAIRPATYSTSWHTRKPRDSRHLALGSIKSTKEHRSGGVRPLSQSDLLAHHAVRSLKKGSKVVMTPTSLSPPVTKATLRELDLTEILRNPQLRHDSVFDPNLMFRPNYDGERGSRKRELASQYWTAVSREVREGCRCTTFLSGQVLPCICATTSSGGLSLVERLPSRIPSLIHELRAIILSLLPSHTSSSSSTPIWTPSAPSDAVTREQIFDSLDPAFLSQQLSRGVLDVGNLATFLGQTLKMHCAPMRDALVDDMVEACTGDNVVKGLRMCFEILELMKLDIANHQLRSLRPYLVQTALDFEQRFFHDVISQRSSAAVRVSLDKTKAWVGDNIESVQPRGSSTTSWAAVPAAVREGVLSLVFEHQSTSTLPETFQLDAYRLSAFHSDVTDLTVVYLLLSLFQQLAFPAKPSLNELDDMRREIWCILATVGYPTSGNDGSGVPAAVGIAKLDTAAWKASVQDVGLQIAVRANAIKNAHNNKIATSTTIPDATTLAVVEAYISNHLSSESKVFKLLQSRLKSTLSCVIQGEMQDQDKSRWWLLNGASTEVASLPTSLATRRSSALRPVAIVVEPSVVAPVASRGLKRSLPSDGNDDSQDHKKLKTNAGVKVISHDEAPALTLETELNVILVKNGLMPLATEIKVLGERIARVTTFHLAVYQDWYTTLLGSMTPI